MLSLTVPMKSWLHTLPVSLKLAVLCVTTIAMFSLHDWPLLLGTAALTVGLYFSLGRSFARIGTKRLKPMLWLLIILFVYHLVTFRVTEGNVICLRLFVTVGLANLVTMTSRLDDMMALVEFLAKPLRRVGLPPRALGIALGLVVLFTPNFLLKGKMLGQSWRARSSRRLSPRLVAPMALGALDDADRVADALRARGGLVMPCHIHAKTEL